MIGHTKAAAGAAGLIKTVLALHHKVLPPTLKAENPDPDLGVDDTPFYLNAQTRPWIEDKAHPRRAGVSSFGFGGSNFHMVLEEYVQDKHHISWDGSVQIIAFCAESLGKLKKSLQTFQALVDAETYMAEITQAAEKSRATFSYSAPYRLLLVFEWPQKKSISTKTELSALLASAMQSVEKIKNSEDPQSFWQKNNIYFGGPVKPQKLGFIFPGQGSQYVGMGRDLICRFPQALNFLQQMDDAFESRNRLSDYIFPPSGNIKSASKTHESALRQTNIAQPSLGSISMAMFESLKHFNISPDATCGHSYGELPALFAAGWIDAQTLIDLSIARGRFMAAAGKGADRPNGSMLAVKASLDALEKMLADTKIDVILANRNSPTQGVLSGSVEAIDEAAKICKQNKFRSIKLPVAAAFHSRLVKDAQIPFMQTVAKTALTPSKTPVFSNTTGTAYPNDATAAQTLLGEQMVNPVDFVKEIESMYQLGVDTFVEVGPKTVLTGLVKSILKGRNFQAVSTDGSSGKGYGLTDLAKTICFLGALGHKVDLTPWEDPSPGQKKPMAKYTSVLERAAICLGFGS